MKFKFGPEGTFLGKVGTFLGKAYTFIGNVLFAIFVFIGAIGMMLVFIPPLEYGFHLLLKHWGICN